MIVTWKFTLANNLRMASFIVTPQICLHGPANSIVPACTLNRPRRPRDYWSKDKNLHSEIVNFNLSLARKLPGIYHNQMPTKSQLRTYGRRDLENAISKYGGFHVVARRLALIRQPTSRRPKNYWSDFSNLKKELTAFLATSDIALGLMPTSNELRKAGRSDIVEGIEYHGGFRAVADALSLASRSNRKPAGYWDEWSTVERELVSFMRKRQPASDALPTQAELRAAHRSDLATAISKHGGLEAAAKILRIAPNKGSSSPAPFYEVALEIYKLSMSSCNGRMPTSIELRSAKRGNHLNKDVSRFGGLAVVARRLGLPYRVTTRETFKDWLTFRRHLLQFIERHGKSGHMPCTRTFSNFGREDLVQGILHHGGERKVASKLNLTRGYLQSFASVGQAILEYIEKHGEPGMMPSERDLLDLNLTSLNVAVSKHGYYSVATRLSLKEPAQSANTAINTFMRKTLDDDEGDWRIQLGSYQSDTDAR